MIPVYFAAAELAHHPRHEFVRGGLADYPETPDRAVAIHRALTDAGGVRFLEPEQMAPERLQAIHAPAYLHFLAHAHAAWNAATGATGPFTPVTFAGATGRLPPGLVDQSGCFAFDATPIARDTFDAAWAAARSARAAAQQVRTGGSRVAYALCRPPGHHAGRASYGGYCYLNNAALAAADLRAAGPVAVLDIDFHHGNGTQDIFYRDGNVLFVSIHGDPDTHYPFYWGTATERGADEGEGANLNLPLPAGSDADAYLGALDRALAAIARFGPTALVVSAGMDTLSTDQLGTFALSADSFARIGQRIRELSLPVVVVQEGGYDLDHIGAAVVALLQALA